MRWSSGRRPINPSSVLLAASLLAGVALAGAAWAESPQDAETLCAKAGRNTAIFELPPEESVARAGAQAGVVQCRWTFGASASAAGLVVELATELLKSEAMARLAIEATRLPENHRGKTIEALPKMGDGGNLLTTVENGKLRFVEIEAVKGRQRFLMTVRPNVPGDLGYRVPGQSINFLGIGLQRL